jgi:methyl-accepting chemotaxis protein
MIDEIYKQTMSAVEAINESVTGVDDSRDLLVATINGLEAIVNNVQQTDGMVSGVRKETGEQTRFIQSVIMNADEVASVAEESSASTEELLSTTEELAASMEEMDASAQQLSSVAEKLQLVSESLKFSKD